MAQTLNGVPGGGEMWKIGKDSFLVYYVPGQTKQIPMIWKVHDAEQVQALFGPGQPITYAKELTKAEANQLGALPMGSREELVNDAKHPFRVLLDNFEREVATRPWLRDPEVMAVAAAALLEGRTLTEEDLASTSWWQSRSEQERSWAILREADPSQAEKFKGDNRLRVEEMARQAGAIGVPAAALNFISDKLTNGGWSESYAMNQIRAIADPFSNHRIDASVLSRLGKQVGDVDGDKAFTSREQIMQRVAAIRSGRGLDPDEASDAIWADRVLSGKATIGDARTRLSGVGVHQGDGAGFEFNIEREKEVTDLVRQWLGPGHGWSSAQISSWAGTLRNDPSGRERLESMLSKQRLALWGEYEDATLTYEDIAAPWRSFMSQAWGQTPDETTDLFQKVVRMNDAGQARALLMEEGLNQGVQKVIDETLGSMSQTFGDGISRDIIRN